MCSLHNYTNDNISLLLPHNRDKKQTKLPVTSLGMTVPSQGSLNCISWIKTSLVVMCVKSFYTVDRLYIDHIKV